MKKILSLLFVAAAATAYAQPKTITQAIITTKTTITSPEGDEDGITPPPAPEGAEQRRFIIGGDGETKAVTTLKGDLIKTFTENEMSRTTIIRDNAKKLTTTILEMMGNKTGFYTTDAEQEEMRKRMDSLMQSRGTQGGFANNNSGQQIVATDIRYVEETKKIAGQQCKKALIVNTRQNGNKDSSIVWYLPDVTLQGISNTGGIAAGFGSGGRTTAVTSFSKLAGFPMQYEVKMNRGRKMVVEVTKLVIDKEIADKEFDIPKDVTLKAAKDMQNGDGRMQIRIGGQGGGGQ
jgi:hypothetical protein